MTWNYRILEDDEGNLSLHEVFYDVAGNPNGCTENPATFVADSDEGVEGIIKALEMALKDAKERPVLKRSGFIAC
jgi:hypothetical protein